MKKKIVVLGLCTALVFSLGGALVSKTISTNAQEDPTVLALRDLFQSYYGDGMYKKHTVINANEESLQELVQHFHAGVTTLERTTYYSKDALWMSRDVEQEGVTYSYYGTSYDADGNANGVTNATATTPLIAPKDAGVALTGENQQSMEEYYLTLDDFIKGSHVSAHTNGEALNLTAGWSVENGVYTSTDADVLDGMRLFAAPLWIGKTETNANYLSYTKATIEEVNSQLVMKLYVSGANDGAIKGSDGDETTDEVFAQAVVSKKGYSENLQGEYKNLQAGLGTDFEGYSPENPDHVKLFDPNSSLTVSSQGTWFKDNNGQKAYAAQSGYKIRLNEEGENVVLKVGGYTHKELFRVGMNLTEEVCEPGTYIAKIKIKRGPEADIPKFFFKINNGSRTDSNVPLQYIKGAATGPKNVAGFFFNNTSSDDPNLNFQFNTEWTEYSTTFTVDEGSELDNATSVCAAFVMYTSNVEANLEKDYLLIDDFQLYRVPEQPSTDFETYNATERSDLFVQTGTLPTGWKVDSTGSKVFGIQSGYQGVKLFKEEDGNQALKIHGTKEVIRAGLDINDDIANPGIYKVTLKVKLGPNANNVGSILFRFHDKKGMTKDDALVSTGYYLYKKDYDVTLSKDGWVTLETEVVVNEKIEFSSDLCFMLMVYTNGNLTNGTDTHAQNYVLVDDLAISKVVFE